MALGNNPTPIWQGVQKTLRNTPGYEDFTVRTETPDALIFSGRATNRPGETSVVVELFDVLAPHLRQTRIPVHDVYLYEETALIVPSTISRRFLLEYGNTSEPIDVCGNYDYGKSALVRPVSREIPSGAPIVASLPYCPTGTIYLKKGATTKASIYNSANQALSVLFQTTDGFDDGDELTIQWPGGTTSGPFKLVGDCSAKWVLYYVNAGGGWDALPIRGMVRRTDEFTRETTENFRRLNQPDVPDRRICRIDAGATWELHTGLLTDEESEIFSVNVPGTPMAILFSREAAGDEYAVSVADTSIAHALTVETNGRRPVDYVINVKLDQERPRL